MIAAIQVVSIARISWTIKYSCFLRIVGLVELVYFLSELLRAPIEIIIESDLITLWIIVDLVVIIFLPVAN